MKRYLKGGQKRFAKEVIEAIDEKKRSITFKVVEGGVLEMYTSFKFIFSIDDESNGQDNSVVTWTIDYEKKSESVPAPHALMDLGVAVTKEIARHYSLVPN
ncbi:UNVERIFIED_CONTAM: Kirola [Sesamum latifolium]|uniref:Kirola n=1 Tax=Sesamum latifolium TaxID=2727402 RepID=A0AAW2WY85_9LAMI